MKKLMMAILMASAAAGTGAQTEPVVDEVRITRPIERIELPRERNNMWASEFDEVKGQYRLSNGKKMELRLQGNHMYATIDGMPRSRLVAASPYVFVALDEKLKITVDEKDPYGPRGVELLMVVPRQVADTTVYEVQRLVASR